MVTPAGYLRAQDLPEDSLSSYPSTYNFIGIKGLDTGTPTLFRGTLPAGGGGGGGSSLAVRDEGTNLTTAATSLDFTGAGVTATNTSGAVTINIPGGVTSVGLSVPSIFTVSGSPVTSSGTLGFSLPSLGMRNFLASPINSTGVPDFRPIHTLDLPSFLDNNARVGVRLGGTLVGTRRRINFIEGSNVTLSVSDDNTNEAVNVTINSSGTGSGLANIPVSDEGSPQGNATSFNFTGNVVATVASNVATVNIPAISASDEGTPLTANVTGFNFVGAGITATQSGGLVTVNVPGGGGGISDGDKGDITVSGSGSVWTIDNDSVTFPKLQNIATNRLLGRSSSGAGDIEEIQIGSGLSLSGGTLSATGGGGGSSISTLVVTSATTATANTRYLCNTSSASFTLTLPASPTNGSVVEIADFNNTSLLTGFGTNPLTIAANTGHTIAGLSQVILDRGGQGLELVFHTNRWSIVSGIGESSSNNLLADIQALIVAGG